MTKHQHNTATALWIVTAAVLLTSACGDIEGPVLEGPSFKKASALAVETTATTADETTDASSAKDKKDKTSFPDIPPGTLQHLPDAPALQTYSTSFTAIQGQGNTFVVFYEDPWTDDGTQGDWFLKLDIPSDAQFVDSNGLPIADGEPVEITIDIDQSYFFWEFGPHGSVFLGKKSALLEVNLNFADLETVDPSSTAVWYQPYIGEDWNPEATEVNVKRNKAALYIHHFSNYAVAW